MSDPQLRPYQCPGCWSYGMFRVPVDGWIECDCGEAMTLIDLRSRHEVPAEPRHPVAGSER